MNWIIIFYFPILSFFEHDFTVKILIYNRSVSMKFKLLLFIFLKFADGSDDSEADINVMIRVVEEILQEHHFGFYMLVNTNESTNQLFYERLLKRAKNSIEYSSILHIHIEQYQEYVDKFYDDFSRIRCLKIINGKSEILRRKFRDVSKSIEFQNKSP